ncbi:MAG: 4Fe-4S dicluster domain-containing protein [Thermoproteota archaeon]
MSSPYLELQNELPRVTNRVLYRSDKPRWVMVVDLRRCVGCYSCQASCKMENGVPFEFFRTKVLIVEGTRRGVSREDGLPAAARVFLPVLCNHCNNPTCISVCPVGATFKRDDGVVVIDYDKCIGCGYCVPACPYGARYLNTEVGKADKCDYCLHRLSEGLLPACVENCPTGARIFGDLNHPDSPVRRILSEEKVSVLKPETGNDPQVFYVGLEEVTTVEPHSVATPHGLFSKSGGGGK